MIKLQSYAAETTQGPYLLLNEDAYGVDLKNNLFSIFDGFGGSGAGDKAVLMAKEAIQSFYTRVGGDPDSTMPFSFSYKYLLEGNALLNSLSYAHKELLKFNEGRNLSQKGGTSAMVLALSEHVATIASVGNCFAYLVRRGRIFLITIPDILELMSEDDPERHFKTTPLSGLGLFEEPHISVRELRLIQSDLLIFSTDGVYSRVSAKEILSVVTRPKIDLSTMCKIIFHLSNERGNLDNQTLLLLQF